MASSVPYLQFYGLVLDLYLLYLVVYAKRGRDYLDWFEITRARETSGVFDDYLKLKSQLKKRENERKDGVSLYLDRMENLFERSKQK